MTTLTKQLHVLTHETYHEQDGPKLVTEASTIGLAPGEWPRTVRVLLKPPWGPNSDYHFVSFDQNGDEITAAHYRSNIPGLPPLLIFND